ncbi:MAG TPA: hypothetical protein VI953_03890 [Candidatus Paceibacterota bacterium]
MLPYFARDVDNASDVERQSNPEELNLILRDEGDNASRGNKWCDIDEIVRATANHGNC